MTKTLFRRLMIVLGGWSLLHAEMPLVIPLEVGMNVVSIRISNKSRVNLESVYLDVNPDRLPEGLSMRAPTQFMDVPSKATSESAWVVYVQVAETAPKGIHEIPITVKSKNSYAWSYMLKVEVSALKPDRYELEQNHPNPFNSSTEIRYALAGEEKQETRLVVYDLLGREIRTLVNEKQSPGSYRVVWDGRDKDAREVSSGVYVYKLVSGTFIQVNRMTLLK